MEFASQLVARTVSGGIAGGIVSEIYGGNFWEGFAQGGATAAAAFLFNESLEKYKADKDGTMIKQAPPETAETFHSDLYWSCVVTGLTSFDVLVTASPIVYGCLATPPPWHFITCPAVGVVIAVPIARECGDYATYSDKVGAGKPPSFYPRGRP